MSCYPFTCSYVRRNGEICGSPCIRETGCVYHWDKRPFVSCLLCGKATQSKYSMCEHCSMKARDEAKKMKKEAIKKVVACKSLNQVNISEAATPSDSGVKRSAPLHTMEVNK